MRFVIGRGKMQEIAKHNAEKIGFWLCPPIFAWRCEAIDRQPYLSVKAAIL
jgi:hypothetical protein